MPFHGRKTLFFMSWNPWMNDLKLSHKSQRTLFYKYMFSTYPSWLLVHIISHELRLEPSFNENKKKQRKRLASDVSCFKLILFAIKCTLAKLCFFTKAFHPGNIMMKCKVLFRHFYIHAIWHYVVKPKITGQVPADPCWIYLTQSRLSLYLL